jgi:hypothetical protein
MRERRDERKKVRNKGRRVRKIIINVRVCEKKAEKETGEGERETKGIHGLEIGIA